MDGTALGAGCDTGPSEDVTGVVEAGGRRTAAPVANYRVPPTRAPWRTSGVSR